MQNALDDFRSNALFLVSFVDDHVPDRRSVHKVCEHPPKTYELIPIPGTESDIRMPEHILGVFERAALGPWRLVKQLQELGSFEVFLFREGNSGLEGGRHLVLD